MYSPATAASKVPTFRGIGGVYIPTNNKNMLKIKCLELQATASQPEASQKPASQPASQPEASQPEASQPEATASQKPASQKQQPARSNSYAVCYVSYYFYLTNIMYTFIVCNVSYLLTRAKYISPNLIEQLKMYAMYAM